jgi:uncharacterized membrane protein (GlpM family)
MRLLIMEIPMWYTILKFIISGSLIVVISEVSRRSSFIGAILASVPCLSIIAFIWLWRDTGSKEKVAELSGSIFWMVIPSLSLFISLPLLLKKLDFTPALIVSLFIMLGFYYMMIFLLSKFGISL